MTGVQIGLWTVVSVLLVACPIKVNEGPKDVVVPPAIETPSLERSSSASGLSRTRVERGEARVSFGASSPAASFTFTAQHVQPATVSPRTACEGELVTIRPPNGQRFPERRIATAPLLPELGVFVGGRLARVESWGEFAIVFTAPPTGGNVWLGPVSLWQQGIGAVLQQSCASQKLDFDMWHSIAPAQLQTSPVAAFTRRLSRAFLPQSAISGGFEMNAEQGALRISDGLSSGFRVDDFRPNLTMGPGAMGRIVASPRCAMERSVCVPDGTRCANALEVVGTPRVERFFAEEGSPGFSSSSSKRLLVQHVTSGATPIRWLVAASAAAPVAVTVNPPFGGPALGRAGVRAIAVTAPMSWELTAANRCGSASRQLSLKLENVLSSSHQELHLTAGSSRSIELRLLDPAPPGGVRVSLSGANESVEVTGPDLIAAGTSSATWTIRVPNGTRPGVTNELASLSPSIQTNDVYADFVAIRVLLDFEPEPPLVRGHEVRGCFAFYDGAAVRQIVGSPAEIWSFRPRPGVWTWEKERTVATDAQGCLREAFNFPAGASYAIRLYAANPAAQVFQQDLPMSPFWVEPGGQRKTLSTDEQLLFTHTFDSRALPAGAERDQEAWIAGHFNLAAKTRLAWQVANSLRAPGETDVITPVAVKPHGGAPGMTYQRFGVIWIHVSRMMDDTVIAHEYAHHLQEDISRFEGLGAVWDECTASLGDFQRPAHAWQEGFADWFSLVVRQLHTAETNAPNQVIFAPCFTNAPNCPSTVANGIPGAVRVALEMLLASGAGTTSCPSISDGSCGAGICVTCSSPTCKTAAAAIFEVFDADMDADRAGSPPANSDGFYSAWSSRGNSQALINAAWLAAGLEPPP